MLKPNGIKNIWKPITGAALGSLAAIVLWTATPQTNATTEVAPTKPIRLIETVDIPATPTEVAVAETLTEPTPVEVEATPKAAPQAMVAMNTTPNPVVAQAAPVATTNRAAVVRAAATTSVKAPQVSQPTVGDTGRAVINVHANESVVVDAPWAVSRVKITNPDIADVEVLTPRQLLVNGADAGTTTLILWSDSGDHWHARVRVGMDLTYVRDEIDALFPDADLEVRQSQDMVVVSGQLRRLEQVDQLHSMLDSYGVKYVDRTAVAGVQQVMINVRVAEVSRDAIRSLGVNAVHGGDDFFGGLTIGPDGGGALNPISIGAPAGSTALGNIPFSFVEDLGVASGITMFGGFPGSDLELFLQALAENQYLRMLAEPTLVALSGEEASFLAGGEFPVPIVQGSSAGAGTSITIEYKEFGVRLNFLPTVLGDNRIRMYVAPEVSDLSDRGAVEIEGFRIPSLLTRRAETTLEMNSGEAFAMAGLLNHTESSRSSRVPLLGDLPILGSLFRSTRYTTGETELMVVVTAKLVEPSTDGYDYPVPGDLHVQPTDYEALIEGRFEGQTPALESADKAWLRKTGLDRLHGENAWADYDRR